MIKQIHSNLLYRMVSLCLVMILFTAITKAAVRKDSIDYHEIKEAMVCFDCINKNQEILRQVISNLEKLDSTKITYNSRGSYYADLSMAFSLLTSTGNEYIIMSKMYGNRAINFSNHYSYHFQLAILYQRELKCDSMEISIQHYIQSFPKSETMDLSQIDQLRKLCTK